MWQLLGIGLLALSAWGYVALHDAKQQEIGAAKITAKIEKDRADAETRLAEAAELARQDAVRQVAVLRKRQAETRQALVTAEATREAANEALARTNAAYADWRGRVLPDVVPDRLRAHIIAISPSAASDRVSR